jgi:hypothetical protein
MPSSRVARSQRAISVRATSQRGNLATVARCTGKWWCISHACDAVAAIPAASSFCAYARPSSRAARRTPPRLPALTGAQAHHVTSSVTYLDHWVDYACTKAPGEHVFFALRNDLITRRDVRDGGATLLRSGSNLAMRRYVAFSAPRPPSTPRGHSRESAYPTNSGLSFTHSREHAIEVHGRLLG